MIPQWDDLNSYPSATTTTRQQWAWEFLRRNNDYKAIWDLYISTGAQSTDAELLKADPLLWAEEAKLLTVNVRRFGIRQLCDPQEDRPGLHELGLLFESQCIVNYLDWQDQPTFDEFGHEQGMDPSAFERALRLEEEGQVIMRFDAREDIESQLNGARKTLEAERKRLACNGKEVASTKHHTDKFPTYLQLLDARDQLSLNSDAELFRHTAPVLAPGEDIDSAEERLKKNLVQALIMRDSGYRFLLLERLQKHVDKEEKANQRRLWSQLSNEEPGGL